MEYGTNYGDNIKKQLIVSKISQKQLANKLGTTQATISRWCNNITQPDYKSLCEICAIIDCDPNEILNFNEQTKQYILNFTNDKKLNFLREKKQEKEEYEEFIKFETESYNEEMNEIPNSEELDEQERREKIEKCNFNYITFFNNYIVCDFWTVEQYKKYKKEAVKRQKNIQYLKDNFPAIYEQEKYNLFPDATIINTIETWQKG